MHSICISLTFQRLSTYSNSFTVSLYIAVLSLFVTLLPSVGSTATSHSLMARHRFSSILARLLRLLLLSVVVVCPVVWLPVVVDSCLACFCSTCCELACVVCILAVVLLHAGCVALRLGIKLLVVLAVVLLDPCC